MDKNEREQLERELSNFIHKNDIQFKLNGRSLTVSKINRLIILSLTPQELYNGDNYSFKGDTEVLLK